MQERRTWNRDQELLARIHILLTSALPLLIAVTGDGIDDRDQVKLAAITAEAATVIQQLLQTGAR
jgi:hypothetical protein